MSHQTTRTSVWRVCDRRTTTAIRRRHAQLNLASGADDRRAEKDTDRRCLDQVDEPNAQHATRGRYLRIRHQADEQAHERESVRLNRTAQRWRTRACQIIPPPRSLARSIYATDDRWDTSIRPHSHSAAPDRLIRRHAAASLSPACQHRGTHLAARARARSIELNRCAAVALKMTRRRSRPAQIMAVSATPRRGHHTVTHVKCDRHYIRSRPVYNHELYPVFARQRLYLVYVSYTEYLPGP